MALLQLIANAATSAIAGAAIEPALEPVRQIAQKTVEGTRKFASRVATTHATGLMTGKSWQESVAKEIARWGSSKAWQEGVFDPAGAELTRWAELIQANPCESMKMAAFLVFNVGDPMSALQPCPPQQRQQQVDRAKWIRYGIFGAIGLGIVWAATR